MDSDSTPLQRSSDRKEIIDLELILRRWAKQEYGRHRSCLQRLTIRSRDIDYQFNWKDVRFHHVFGPNVWNLNPPTQKAKSELRGYTDGLGCSMDSDSTPLQRSSDRKEIIDLELILRRWAKQEYERHRSCLQRLTIRSRDIDYQFNWKDVRFHHVFGPNVWNLNPPTQKAKILFETTFENRTTSPQNYSFQTERTTNSTCAVELEQGVTRGVEAALTLKTPGEILEASSTFKQETTMTETQSETLVEELKWSNDSQIMVNGNSKATASLVVDENCYKDNVYTVKSYFYGDIKVNLVNRKDNSLITHIAGDVVRIISGKATLQEEKVLVKDTSKSLHPYDRDVMTFTTRAKATFNFGVKQEVKLTEEKLG